MPTELCVVNFLFPFGSGPMDRWSIFWKETAAIKPCQLFFFIVSRNWKLSPILILCGCVPGICSVDVLFASSHILLHIHSIALYMQVVAQVAEVEQLEIQVHPHRVHLDHARLVCSTLLPLPVGFAPTATQKGHPVLAHAPSFLYKGN